MLGNIGKEGIKKLSDEQLNEEFNAMITELHEKHGYSVTEAIYFVSNCYLLIRELRDRKPDEPIKLI